MENENVETVETENTQETTSNETESDVTTKTGEETQEKKVKSSDVLRELSKEFSVNLFDENGLTMLKEKWGNETKEKETFKTQVDTLTKEKNAFAQKEQEYQSKIEALGMGFQSDQIDEVIKLAKVYTDEGQSLSDGLKVVKEKYGGVFVAKKNIGLQMNDIKGDKPDVPRTEQDKYMATSPAVQKWNKMNKTKN